MDDKINLWEIGTKINVKVSDDFLCLINKKIRVKYGTKERIYNELIKYYNLPFSTFKDKLKKSYKYFVDLEVMLNLCKILNLSYLFSTIKLKSKQSHIESVMRGCSLREHSSIYFLRR